MLAFTVIELMLAVSIMGVIVYALYSVFNQTQRAMRKSETDTDVSQRARMVVGMISRELQQAQPTFGFWPVNSPTGVVYLKEVNMLGGFDPDVTQNPMSAAPRVQVSDRSDVQNRTNYLHNIFFYNNQTNAWQAIGYRVTYVTNGVGVLQRFETSQFGYRPISNALSDRFKFATDSLTNRSLYHHVADGVVHLAFVPYDALGQRLGWDTPNRGFVGTRQILENYTVYRQHANGTWIQPNSDTADIRAATVVLQEVYPQADLNQQYMTSFSFRSNAMPAYIEMELGILEPATLEQFSVMVEDGNFNAATNFLARQMSKVHLFRQRIPIRTAAQ